MGKIIKRILASVLTVVMLLTAAPMGGIDLPIESSAKDISSYQVGEIIKFGSYPQNKVTDITTLSALDNITNTG